jgi:hypothetical protein
MSINMISIKTTPISLHKIDHLEAWLRLQGLEIAHEQDMPDDWRQILQMKGGCIVKRILYEAPSPHQASVGFTLVPGRIVVSRLSSEGCFPLISDHETLIPERQLTLVKRMSRQ